MVWTALGSIAWQVNGVAKVVWKYGLNVGLSGISKYELYCTPAMKMLRFANTLMF